MATTSETQLGQLPPITLPTLDGEPINLATYRGKKLIVFMWASW